MNIKFHRQKRVVVWEGEFLPISDQIHGPIVHGNRFTLENGGVDGAVCGQTRRLLLVHCVHVVAALATRVVV